MDLPKVNAAGLEGFHGIAFRAKMGAQNVKENLDLGHPCDFVTAFLLCMRHVSQ